MCKGLDYECTSGSGDIALLVECLTKYVLNPRFQAGKMTQWVMMPEFDPGTYMMRRELTP